MIGVDSGNFIKFDIFHTIPSSLTAKRDNRAGFGIGVCQKSGAGSIAVLYLFSSAMKILDNAVGTNTITDHTLTTPLGSENSVVLVLYGLQKNCIVNCGISTIVLDL